MNRYLRDRAMRRMDRASGRRGSYNISGNYDRRNPYGSAGGYVRDSESRGGRGGNRGNSNDYNMDYERTNRNGNRGDYSSDYNYGSDYHYGYNMGAPIMDYNRYDRKAERDEEDEYYKELERWTNKLKRKNKFNINENQVMEMAKRSNLSMKDYDEKEFYATFLMMVSDYGKVSSDPQMFVEMSKAFLEDDDTELKGSEKLCKYLYAIVLDDDE